MSTILCLRFVYIVLQVIHKFWWFHLCQCCVCVCMYIHMCGFFLIFSTDSEGSGNGSEDPSKDSGEGSCSDSEENILEEELNEDIQVKEEQLKNSTEEIMPSDKQLIKMEKKEEEGNGERPRKKKEKEKEKKKEREKDKEKATVSDSAAASAADRTSHKPSCCHLPFCPYHHHHHHHHHHHVGTSQ